MNSITNKIKLANFRGNEIWMICIIIIAIITGTVIAVEKWLLLGILFIPLFLYLCVHKPFIFPFGIYVLLIPFDSVLSITGGATLTKLLGILTILTLLLKGAYEHKLKLPTSATIWWFLFVIYGVSSLLWAIEPDSVFAVIPTLTGLFFLYFVLSLYKINKDEFEIIKWFIIIGAAISSLYVIYNYSEIAQYADEVNRLSMEAGGRHDDPNRYAFSLLIPVSCVIQMMMTCKKRHVIIMCGCLLGIILFSIILTGSRGAMLGVGAILATYILFSKQRISFSMVIIIIGAVIISFIPDFYYDRWIGVADEGGAGRTSIWEIGLHSLKKYGFYGAGLNNFPNAYNEFINTTSSSFSKSSRAPHNIALGFFVELGFIGVMFMLAAFITHYRSIKKKMVSSASDVVMLKASFWAVLVSSLFLDTVFIKSFWLLWIMIMCHANIWSNDFSGGFRRSDLA